MLEALLVFAVQADRRMGAFHPSVEVLREAQVVPVKVGVLALETALAVARLVRRRTVAAEVEQLLSRSSPCWIVGRWPDDEHGTGAGSPGTSGGRGRTPGALLHPRELRLFALVLRPADLWLQTAGKPATCRLSAGHVKRTVSR